MKLDKFLAEMVGHFTPNRASDWLRFLFSSFETDAEPIAVDTTKNESAYFAEARRLGWVARLPETDSAEAANKPLVVVAVRMKGDLTERTSRLVQFAFAKKVIQNAIARGGRGIHGLPTQGLFFFYDADGYFRISLVSGEADGRKLKYKSAKRQSFYVDPTAANNILRRRLGDQITTFAALKNAFSVEQLTKEFYGRLFEWYTWALAPRTGVTFPNDLADEKDDRKYNHEAIIRLITRLMFTWFIRQKIPALQELFERRMALVGEIAAYKQAHGLPVLDPVREAEKLAAAEARAAAGLASYDEAFFLQLMELSRRRQEELLGEQEK